MARHGTGFVCEIPTGASGSLRLSAQTSLAAVLAGFAVVALGVLLSWREARSRRVAGELRAALERRESELRGITERKETEESLRKSEAKFRAVLETSIDGFMVLESIRDPGGSIVDFRWLHANEASERIVGKPRSWFIGRRLLEELPGNRSYGLYDGYVKVVESGEPWTHEFAYREDGLDVHLRVIAAKAGDGFAVSFADLSEHRRAEQLVRDRERQFVGLANAIPQLAWTASSDGVHDYYNNGWYAYTGLTEADSKESDTWERVLHPEDVTRTAARWRQSLNTGLPYEMEFRLRRHDGVYRWFLARAVADRDAAGAIIQWFGTCTDIDSAKRSEAALRKTEMALREADQRKDVFLATLSHELRNPLAPIRTAARLLESPGLGPKEVGRIQAIISRQVAHMTSLLEDLLDVSRITRGALSLRKSYISLRGIFEAAVETAQPLIDQRAHRLSVEWPSEDLIIEADSVRLTQVIANLLTNAARYTNAGGTIHLGFRIDTENLAVFVADSGIGLLPDMRARVFEMFTQAEPDLPHSEGGLGIGLALAKGLVELHGGRIEAHSAGLGEGSEFVVLLPIDCLEPRPASDAIPAEGSDSTRKPSRRVLLVDDNRDGAESLAMFLELSGHEVTVAHCGLEALERAAELRPEICVLDIGMPDLSGYEVAKQIRREAWGARMTLIALTGWGQDEDKRAAQAAGFDHHLTKPTDPVVLEQLLVSSRAGQDARLALRAG